MVEGLMLGTLVGVVAVVAAPFVIHLVCGTVALFVVRPVIALRRALRGGFD